jgi:RHS repeat-associated protein
MPIHRSVDALVAACALLALHSSLSLAAAPEVRPKVQSPFDGTPIAIPARIEAEKFDNGLSGESYSDTTAGNVGGAYRTTDVDLYALVGAGNGHYLGNTANNEWVEYTVSIATPGTYTMQLRYASTNASANIAVSLDGASPFFTNTLPTTGGATTFSTTSAGALNLPSGTQVLRIAFPVGSLNLDWIEFTRLADAPAVRLVAPATNVHVNAPATVPLEATVVDIGSSPITQVEFLNGGTVIGADTTAPYTFNWTNVPAGSYFVRARATNGVGTQSLSVTRLVNVRAATPYGGTARTIPGRVQAEDFDDGSGHFDTTTGNASGVYRALNVDLVSVPGPGVAVNTTGTEWTEYTVNVAQTATYTLGVAVAANAAGGTLTVLVDGIDIAGTIAVPNTGSLTTFQTQTRTGITLTAGTRVVRLSTGAGTFNIDWLEFAQTNRLPVVSITSPTNGQHFGRPATVSLAATASDPDGSIQYVEFLSGSTVIATDNSAPYAATWTPPSNVANAYLVTARAVDNGGGSSSASAHIAVTTNLAPTVSIQQPTSGRVFAAPASIAISAVATDPDGTISQVEIRRNGVVIASGTSGSLNFNWTGVGQGNYLLTAVARDNVGAITHSNAVPITVNATNQPPAVVLTSPSYSQTFLPPGNIILSAIANDADGGVARVEFLAASVEFPLESTVINTDSTAPYVFYWTNVPRGNYSLSARAFDVNGEWTETQGTNVRVNSFPVASVSSPATNVLLDRIIAGNAVASIVVRATATDSDPSDSISRVDFQLTRSSDNSVLETFTDFSGPTWESPAWDMPVGTYRAQAIAYDGFSSESGPAVRTFTVSPPIPFVRYTAPTPANAALLKRTPSTPTRIAAIASEQGGSIARVIMRVADTELDATAAPTPEQPDLWVRDIGPLAPGTYSVHLSAIDHLGFRTTGTPEHVRTFSVADEADFRLRSIDDFRSAAGLVFGATKPVKILARLPFPGTSAPTASVAFQQVQFQITGPHAAGVAPPPGTPSSTVNVTGEPPYVMSWEGHAGAQAVPGYYTVSATGTPASGAVFVATPVVVEVRAGQQAFMGYVQSLNNAVTAPTRIEVENYDFGGEGVAHHDNDAQNQVVNQPYRRNDAEIRRQTFFVSNQHYVVMADGEWLEYTVDVTTPGTYGVRISQANATESLRLRLSANAVGQPTSQTVIATTHMGGQTLVAADAPLALNAAGRYVLRLSAERLGNAGAGTVDLDHVEIGPVGPAQPRIELTSPIPGASFSIGQRIPVAAEVQLPPSIGQLQDVLFMRQAVSGEDAWWVTLGLDETPPYRIDWIPEAAERYQVFAFARTAAGNTLSNTIHVTVTEGQPTQFEFTSPVDGRQFAPGIAIPIAVIASGAYMDGVAVQFLAGPQGGASPTLIATDSTPPYSTAWVPPGPGTYRILARANAGAAGALEIVRTVTVNQNVVPIVRLQPDLSVPECVIPPGGVANSRVPRYHRNILVHGQLLRVATQLISPAPGGQIGDPDGNLDRIDYLVSSRNGQGDVLVDDRRITPYAIDLRSGANDGPATLAGSSAVRMIRARSIDLGQGTAGQAESPPAPLAVVPGSVDAQSGSCNYNCRWPVNWNNAATRVEAESVDFGGQGVAYFDTTLGGSDQDLDTDMHWCDEKGNCTPCGRPNPASPRQCRIDYEPGEWTEYSIQVAGPESGPERLPFEIRTMLYPPTQPVGQGNPCNGVTTAPVTVSIGGVAGEAAPQIETRSQTASTVQACPNTEVTVPILCSVGVVPLLRRDYIVRFTANNGAELDYIEFVPVTSPTTDSIRITSPSPGAIFPPGSTVQISSDALTSSNSATISYSVTNPLGAETDLTSCSPVAPSYTCQWTVPMSGSDGDWRITARVRDATTVTASASVDVKVAAGQNAPPLAELLDPLPNAQLVAGRLTTLRARAVDQDGPTATATFQSLSGQSWTNINATPVSSNGEFATLNWLPVTGVSALRVVASDGSTTTTSATVLVTVLGAQGFTLTSSATSVVPGTTVLLGAEPGTAGVLTNVRFEWSANAAFTTPTVITSFPAPPYSVSWTTPSSTGNYYVRAVGTTSAPATVYSNVVVITAEADDQTVESLAAELTPYPHNPEIGALAGKPGTSGGAATYEIPITVPPGRRGVEPSLSLSYSSKAGGGPLGMGWSLSGLSSIHRCPQTLAQDGRQRKVSYDNSDRLCLDGQRLVCTNCSADNANYGTAGRVYRTELDSFSQVTQSATDLTSASTSFTVRTKSGDTLTYGTDASSRNTPSGASAPLAWLIKRRSDPAGNYLTHTYTEAAAGETLISRIEYTGFDGAGGALLPTRSVRFDYGDRPAGSGIGNDLNSSYLSGALTLQTKRIVAIRTFVDETRIRTYKMGYGVGGSSTSLSSRRSLLRTIQECATNTAGTDVCRPATQVEWLERSVQSSYGLTRLSDALGSDALSVPSLAAPDLNTQPVIDENGVPTQTVPPAISGTPIGDLDGDGTRELWVATRAQGSVPASTRILTMGADRRVSRSIVVPQALADGAYFPEDASTDFNNDGRAEILYRRRVSDVGGVGLSVLQWNDAAGTMCLSLSCGVALSGFTFDPAQHAIVATTDLNADGWTDIAISTLNMSGDRTVSIYLNQRLGSGAPSFQLATSFLLDDQYPGESWEEVMQVLDLNGDGLPDFWIQSGLANSPGAARVIKRVLLGNSVLSAVGVPTYSVSTAVTDTELFESLGSDELRWLARGDARFVDINGDGLADIVYPVAASALSPGTWSARLNKGGRTGSTVGYFGPRIDTGSSLGLENQYIRVVGGDSPGLIQRFRYSSLIRPTDVDADGRSELLVPSGFFSRVCVAYFKRPGGVSQCARPADGQGRGTQCELIYRCPELPRGPDLHVEFPGLTAAFAHDLDDNGQLDPADLDPSIPLDGRFELVEGLYRNASAQLDSSLYRSEALRFIQTGASTIVVEAVPTNILIGQGRWIPDDLFSDGLQDVLIENQSCPFRDRELCGVPIGRMSGTPGTPQWIPESEQPRTLPPPLQANGILSRRMYVAENLGAGTGPAGSGRTVPNAPDTVAAITDGLGRQVRWSYHPLSAQAGRAAGELPFYVAVPSGRARYIDDRHFLFTSSMNVVDSMTVSTGVPSVPARMFKYGYEEAIYNTRGRGFQGFRAITEIDVEAGARTRTVFHQKFPLTSRAESVTTTVFDPINPGDATRTVQRETQQYSCDRTLRAGGEVSCTFTDGPITTPRFPFAASSITTEYDAGAASDLGTPYVETPVVRRSITSWFAGKDPPAACTTNGTEGSSFDAFGNLLCQTSTVEELTATASLGKHVTHTITTLTNDTATWWLGKLSRTEQRLEVTAGVGAPLPNGVTLPNRTTVKTITWNDANRTPNTETLQPDTPSERLATTYTYPSAGQRNFGLPIEVSVAGLGSDGTTTQTRSSTTEYTTGNDAGYFPRVSTNALGHQVQVATRARDGLASSQIDANGLVTSLTYDPFGQLVESRVTDQSAPPRLVQPVQYLHRYGPQADSPPGTAYEVIAVQDGAPTSRTAYDLMDRPIRISARRMDQGTTVVDTSYTARGQIAATTEPRDISAPAVHGTSHEYDDVLGRPTRKVSTRSDSPLGDLQVDYIHRGLDTTVRVCGTAQTTASGACATSGSTVRTMVRRADAFGRFTYTQDARGGATRFWHDPAGNPVAIRDANNQLTKAGYDNVGRRTSVDDPNQGASTFLYTAFGEVRSEQDARSIVTTTLHDVLGRPQFRRSTVDVEGLPASEFVEDAWTYDPLNAKGSVATAERRIGANQASATTRRKYTYAYDALSRPTSVTTLQRLPSGAQEEFTERSFYDSYYGRVSRQVFPSGDAVRFTYSRYGHLLRETDAATGAPWRVVEARNDRGQITQERLGAQIISRYAHDDATGQMRRVEHARGSTVLRAVDYSYDVFSNLASQALIDGSVSANESFEYDNLQRLREATRTSGSAPSPNTVCYGYDAIGNFRFKSDFSQAPNCSVAANDTTTLRYQYGTAPRSGATGNAGPNAVWQVQLRSGGTRSYSYDNAGNLIGDNSGFNASYDHANLTVRTQRNTVSWAFQYGPSNERTWSSGPEGERIHISPSLERVLGSVLQDKTYLGDFAVLTRSGGSTVVSYLLKERLGSIGAIADAGGNLVERRAFDPFGKPRSADWSDATPPRLSDVSRTPRGFTQHEHLNSLELIHMNGRVYDYNLGRFLSVDPVIQFPRNSQSLNPYSYILNNPLSGTDPTGYAIKCDNVKPSDVPAGGSTSCTVTEDRPGSRIKTTTNVEVTRSQDGTRSYIQVGATASNGARLQQGATGNTRDGSSRGAQAIEGAESRDRIQAGLNRVQSGIGTGVAVVEAGLPEDGTDVLVGLAIGPAAKVARKVGESIYDQAKRLGVDSKEVAALKAEANQVTTYRPTIPGFENHHGILDVWASQNVQGYISRGANTPTIRLSTAQHDATRAVYRAWLAERTGRPVGGRIDWTSVSQREAMQLSERMFDAADVPQGARDEYYRAFNQYIYRSE